jgi:uncharacterized protein (DUF433 family)
MSRSASAPQQAWTTEQVLRITGVSRRRLAYWLDRGILTADIDEARGRGRVRLWSFSNLLEVKVALWLRDRVSLQLIGTIVNRLRAEGTKQPLAEMRFAVVDTGKPKRPTDVIIQRADGPWELSDHQVVMEGVLPLTQFAEEVRRESERDRARRRQPGRIERKRGRLGSTDVFSGTRVPVAAIRRLRAAGWSDARIIENYPGLTRRDLAAANEDAASG